jgi:hypothetical protein
LFAELIKLHAEGQSSCRLTEDTAEAKVRERGSVAAECGHAGGWTTGRGEAVE